MSYGTAVIRLNKHLVLDKRKLSPNWYARMTLDTGLRLVRSTKTQDVAQAKEFALEFYYDVKARVRQQLPASTRKFKHVAEFVISKLQQHLDAGSGKQAYRDYISALKRWLIPYFGSLDITKIDLAALTAFDEWRSKQHQKPFSQSGINNHNAALNRVFDEAELRGWMNKTTRPTLLNKGVVSKSRGSFSKEEYKILYRALRGFSGRTENEHASATRETLRNYVLFLANTGVRHGTEALGIQWRHLEWHFKGGERYLAINVDGKTNARKLIARDNVIEFLTRQFQLNPRLNFKSFDDLLAAKSAEPVWTTRLGTEVKIANLNRAFNRLLEELELKTGADGLVRSLYSLRHFYATQDLERGLSTHQLAKQMGNSTAMLDKHYSKVSPLVNASLHSGRTAARPAAASSSKSTVEKAFALIGDNKLSEEGLIEFLGADADQYKPTDEIKLAALQALSSGVISERTMLTISGA